MIGAASWAPGPEGEAGQRAKQIGGRSRPERRSRPEARASTRASPCLYSRIDFAYGKVIITPHPPIVPPPQPVDPGRH